MARRKVLKENELVIDIPDGFLPGFARWIVTDGKQKIQTSAAAVAAQARQNAPELSGDLKRGIIVSLEPERSAKLGKIVFEVFIDPGMNDKFVKVTHSGTRYYYPASQEYGFRTRQRGGGYAIGNTSASKQRVPGRYFMKMAAVMHYGAHIQAVEDAVKKILEEAANAE